MSRLFTTWFICRICESEVGTRVFPVKSELIEHKWKCHGVSGAEMAQGTGRTGAVRMSRSQENEDSDTSSSSGNGNGKHKRSRATKMETECGSENESTTATDDDSSSEASESESVTNDKSSCASTSSRHASAHDSDLGRSLVMEQDEDSESKFESVAESRAEMENLHLDKQSQPSEPSMASPEEDLMPIHEQEKIDDSSLAAAEGVVHRGRDRPRKRSLSNAYNTELATATCDSGLSTSKRQLRKSRDIGDKQGVLLRAAAGSGGQPPAAVARTRKKLRRTKRRSSGQNKSEFKCPECGEHFASERGLAQHARVHSGARRFPCEFCARRYESSQALQSHVMQCHEQKRFACDQCGKVFPKAATLKLHLRSHTGEKPYQCRLCTYRGPYFSSISDHIKRYHGVNAGAMNSKGEKRYHYASAATAAAAADNALRRFASKDAKKPTSQAQRTRRRGRRQSTNFVHLLNLF